MKNSKVLPLLACVGVILSSSMVNCNQKTSISDDTEYLNAAAQAAETLGNFKSDPSYVKVLEHTTYEDGKRYLGFIKKEYPNVFKRISSLKINDKVGAPALYQYSGIGQISPSTLRYAKIAGDLERFFPRLNGKKILEIGGGYGGQALVLNKLFNVPLYQLIDLDSPLKLQSAYLKRFNVVHKIIATDKLHDVEDYDLLISNYAFSECSRSIQEEYLSKVISKAKFGYMICNQISHLFSINNLDQTQLVERLKSLGFSVTILDEDPLTFEGNYLLVFTKL